MYVSPIVVGAFIGTGFWILAGVVMVLVKNLRKR